MYEDSRVTKILKIKVIKQDNTGLKIYVTHIPLTVNSVHRQNIKQLLNTNPWSEKKKKGPPKRSVFLNKFYCAQISLRSAFQ